MLHLARAIGTTLAGARRLSGYLTEPALSAGEIHRVAGEPRRVTAPPAAECALRVVSWNIERGVAFDRVLETLTRLDADLCLLQEVDMFCRRSGGRNVARDLAVALDLNWVFAGEFQEIGERRGDRAGLTGQAILSRYPIEDARTIRFVHQASVFRWRLNLFQPRRGRRIAIRARSARLLLFNAHLESGRDEGLRRRQIEEILEDERGAADAGAPVIVAGDFNNRPAISSPVLAPLTAAMFEDALGDAGNDVRRTSVRRHHPIDWIFVKHLCPSDGHVDHRHSASDHHPVTATIRLMPAPCGPA